MEQNWSAARCHYVVYFTAMYCDEDVAPQEQAAFEALVRRVPCIRELSDETIENFKKRTQWACDAGLLDEELERALSGLNADTVTGLSIYANCADIIRADRKIRSSEVRFMDKVSKALGIPEMQRALIEKVMDAKNRH
ncbi:MAG: TerB family tellurite resistance protein [Hyphomonas sp.]